MSDHRPNVIYILSDQHRGQAMAHAGDPNVRTPSMDRLAREGVSFSRAYCNCPVCTPSRGTIFSGRHAHCGPVQSYWDVYKATAPSTATLLRDAGYHTTYFGKWHCGVILDQTPESRRSISGKQTACPANARMVSGRFSGMVQYSVRWIAFRSLDVAQ